MNDPSDWTVLALNGGRQRIIVDQFTGQFNPALPSRIVEYGDFNRYESPFEQKWSLDKTSTRTSESYAGADDAAYIFRRLESLCGAVAVAMNIPDLVVDDCRHYAGFFRYGPGDALGVHVDAGIHPLNKLRKRVTVLLYFGGSGNLEMWDGLGWNGENARCGSLLLELEPEPGRLVIFENTDWAWHGTRANHEPLAERLVATVSFLSGPDPRAFCTNPRERAFFVPRPAEHWTAETYALRDKRADAEHFAEAYRA